MTLGRGGERRPARSRRLRKGQILLCSLVAGLAAAGPAHAACSTSGSLSVCLTPPATVSGDGVVIAPGSTTGNPSRVTYTLDGAHLLVAFDPPYAFTWPTTRYPSGAHLLGVSATAGTTTTPEVTFPVTIANAGSPPSPGTFVPRHGTVPAPGRPFTLAAGGDGASGEAASTSVTDEIASWSPNMLLYLGDVYDDGTAAEFFNWYGAATHRWFDQFNAITNPVIGNHEYDAVLGNSGYVGYWGTGADFYSVDVAGWHLIALNSNTQLGPARSAQELAWLQADLAADPPGRCTLAFYHHPGQNAGPEGEPVAGSLAANLWNTLAGRADVVLNGHDHSYQRFRPLQGTTEFVVGTTGHSRQAPAPDARLVAFAGDTFGALRAELNPHGFGFRFIDDGGRVLDAGAIPCTGATDTAPPAAPSDLVEGPVSRTAIGLQWSTPRDDVGVTGYDVLRDGALLGTTAGDTHFEDTSVQSGIAYTYVVRARDGAGHVSAPSAPLVLMSHSIALLDTFESGDLAGWPSHAGPVTVTPTAAHVGAFGLHVEPAAGAAFASRSLQSAFGTLEALVDVRISSHTTQANLVTFADATGARIVTVFSQNTTGKLCYVVGTSPTPVCQTSLDRIDDTAWHTLRVRATTGGSPGLAIELDHAPVPGLGGSPSLGTAPIARLVLGTTVAESFAADFDQVAADPLPIGDIVAPSAPAAITLRAVDGLRVNLAWPAGGDDVGVTGYEVFRNDRLIAVLGPTTTYADRSVDGLATYTYAVQARDAAANVSGLSPPASVDTPIVLREGFDTAAALHRFAPAARLGWDRTTRALHLPSGAHGRIALPEPASRLFVRLRFRIASRGANRVPLVALRSSTGTILAASLDAGGRLGAVQPASGQWHDLQVHADTGARESEIWLDGQQRPELTTRLAAGLPPITAVELGGAGRFDMLVDDLTANTTFLSDTVRPSTPRLTLRLVRSGTVALAWTASRDDVAVAGYRIFRGGIEIGRTTAGVRRFVDRAAPPGARAIYAVRAADAAGNLSAAASRVIRVPWFSAPGRRLIRAGHPIRLSLPPAGRAVVLSLRVRPRSAPRGAVVARLGTTVVRFPRSARRNHWIALRVRVSRPGTTLRLGGAKAVDVDRVLVR